ncbi:MAG: GNAT family N-acetyltransferase [Dehalococcoidia bacterium]|nr:GNAT family N-acetyltransferase [Dehalococcoidia bacterium]
MGPPTVDHHRLEEVLLNATAPPEQLFYDGWLLRLSREHIKRAASVNTTFTSTLPLAEKVDTCQHVYRNRGLVPIFRLTSQPAAAPGLDAELEARGYRIFEPSLVQAAPLKGLGTAIAAPAGMRFETTEVEPWVAMVGRLRGWPEHDVVAHIRRMTSSVLPSHCLSLMEGDTVASCGLVTLEGQYAGLFDIYTPPEYRGRGLATVLCRALLAIGRDSGATTGWLSVLASNDPALAVYRRLGFTTAYDYWYRVPPDY